MLDWTFLDMGSMGEVSVFEKLCKPVLVVATWGCKPLTAACMARSVSLMCGRKASTAEEVRTALQLRAYVVPCAARSGRP
eukprot:3465870-Pyramimonas_sp.AAC.1